MNDSPSPPTPTSLPLFIRLFAQGLVLQRCLTTMLTNNDSQDELTIPGRCPHLCCSFPNQHLGASCLLPRPSPGISGIEVLEVATPM